MYDIKTIQEKWKNLLGWQQGFQYNDTLIKQSLTVSDSGEYYQQQHPYITLEKIKSILPNYNNVAFPVWVSETAYPSGSIVLYNSVNYKAIQDTTNQQPDNTDYWEVFNPLSDYLTEKVNTAITKTVQSFVETKIEDKTAKNIIEDRILFNGVGMISETIENTSKKVGLEIGMAKSKGLLSFVDRIGLQFDTIGDITIYLYHSSQKEALESVVLDYSKAGSMQWFDLNWSLPYVSDKVDAAGYYYICYNQDELPGKAINKRRNWLEPCITCGDYGIWELYSKFMEISPFNTANTGSEMWNIEDTRYDYNTNYGLNLSISVRCDYTAFFVDNKSIFTNLLGKQLAMIILREIAYNPNATVNRSESTISREQLLYEIDGDTRGRKTGIKYEYDLALKAVSLSTEGLHQVCLPCKRKGVKYRTV